MPAYSYDPFHYRLHKMNGGSLSSYNNKSHRPLNIQEIRKHLNGGQQIGVYPLLKDDTSWFLAADFDGGDWQKGIQWSRVMSQTSPPILPLTG